MHQVFEHREDAGKQLAKKLSEFHETNALILGIPRGGVPVAAAAAHRLKLEWNVIVTRKLPIPWNPEAGFGAVAADGSIVINESMVQGLQLDEDQINKIADAVRFEVVRRTEAFSRERPPSNILGRDVIVLDDGLASGYTMLAAIKSVRSHNPSRIIATAPVASRSAAQMVCDKADQCIFGVVSSAVPFAVADFYLDWSDLTDEDILPVLRSS